MIPPLLTDALALTQALIRFDTINPPGREAECADFVAGLLGEAGFTVERHEHAPGRPSLIARAGDRDATRALCFVGHLDTVPLGKADWTQSPFTGEVVDGRLYGRGASDMKSGVAAFICAAAARAPTLPADAQLVLLLVAGEETGCEGSLHLAALGLPAERFCGVIVAEPTENFPLLGHKGALWLTASAQGVSAHGAMPARGVNAIRKGVEIVRRLDGFLADRPAHPVLGEPTLNVGTFHAGENVNSVPDWAEIGLDIRTIPGLDHQALQTQLAELLQPELHALSVRTDMSPVFTPFDDPWVQRVFGAVTAETGVPARPATAAYFTDASALVGVLGGAPILILGPGLPALMHQTDEYCEVARIGQAVTLYLAIIDLSFDAAAPVAAPPSRLTATA